MALARNQTLKELATPTLNQQPLCIDMPQLEVAFELKSGMIHLLPTFHGLVGKDPNKHLKGISCCVLKYETHRDLCGTS